jgi:hypothetical protein
MAGAVGNFIISLFGGWDTGIVTKVKTIVEMLLEPVMLTPDQDGALQYLELDE